MDATQQGASHAQIPITLPSLGDAIETATVSQWLKDIGDFVVEGEALVEVSTDKVDTEVPSPASGTLIQIHIGEDETAAVGDILATITVADLESPSTPAQQRVAVENMPAQPSRTAPPTPPASESVSVQQAASQTSEVLRSAAMDTATLPETPTEHHISSFRGTTQKMSRLRKLIAKRMVESLQTSAQLTTVLEADISEVDRIRRRYNEQHAGATGVKLSFLPFIAKAALEALQELPQVNSSVDIAAEAITYPGAEHLGIAVDTPKGLYVPVIKDAGSLSVTELAVKIAAIAERTRAGAIGVDELAGGTFTITNTGSRGALFDTPIINQPQVAILGAGVVTRRPVAIGRHGEDESIAIRSMIYLSLTYDHRVVDGADAARFLSAVKTRLERPVFDIGSGGYRA